LRVVKQVYADRPDPTIENRSASSSAVLVGTVSSIEPGRWNTPTGDRPDELIDTPGQSTIIYRPVAIKTDSLVRGEARGSELTVRWLGGQAECDYAGFEGGSALDLKLDSQYAFFLGASTNADETQTEKELTILGSWLVTADGRIETPLDGTLSISAFTTQVERAPEP
jgi:hypothetical protein